MPLRIVIDARHIKDFGIGTHIRNLVQELSKLDSENRYTVVCHRADFQEFAGLPENFRTAAYERNDLDTADHLTFPLFVRRFSPNLCHIPVNRVAMWMPRPYIVTVHDLSRLLFGQLTGLRNQMSLYRARRGLMRASKVIAVSGATRRDVENLLGIPSDRIRQIYGAPDPKFLEHTTPDENRADARTQSLERYQIRYPYVLYTGNIRPQKNIPRLIEAFAVLHGELANHPVYKDLRLIIIGDEISQYPAVRRKVIQSRIGHAVRFLGFVPQDTLRTFYEAAAAFAFPSLYEGFGLPPLEAMACGTPVVTSSLSSLPEVVGDAAMLVNPENVFDIARGLRELLLDEQLRARLVQRGYEQVKRFSWQHTARQVLETYLEVV